MTLIIIRILIITIQTLVLSNFTGMQDLGNNSWIILDPLGNIYEMNKISVVLKFLVGIWRKLVVPHGQLGIFGLGW